MEERERKWGEGLEEERERGTQVKYTTSECDINYP